MKRLLNYFFSKDESNDVQLADDIATFQSEVAQKRANTIKARVTAVPNEYVPEFSLWMAGVQKSLYDMQHGKHIKI
jgi:Cys-tRNA synthase (O-phospho-L-seryl-tRNA:Cys-tRNA synthase)